MLRLQRRTDRPQAFTIIEVLVVVAILVLLASVGVMQLSRAQIVTREQLAISNLRTLSKACHWYFLSQQDYPPNLASLGSANPPFVEAQLAADPATKQGYRFTYVPAGGGPPVATFELHARPVSYLVSGERSFYTDQSLIVHATSANSPAGPGDPVIP